MQRKKSTSSVSCHSGHNGNARERVRVLYVCFEDSGAEEGSVVLKEADRVIRCAARRYGAYEVRRDLFVETSSEECHQMSDDNRCDNNQKLNVSKPTVVGFGRRRRFKYMFKLYYIHK